MSDVHPLWPGEIDPDATDPLDRIPYLRDRLTSGWGNGSVTQDPDDPYAPLTIVWGITQRELEEMGPEERQRLGLEAQYQRGLKGNQP